MRFPALVFIALAALSAHALADTVKLKNGDTITGKIVTLAEGKLTLKTDAAGEIKIDVTQIATITSDSAIEIHMKDGKVVNERVTAGEPGTIKTAGGTEQVIQLGEVKSVNPEKLGIWTGSVLGAASWSRGNTYSNNATFDAHAQRRGENDRITFDGWYRGVRSEDQTTGNLQTTERREGLSGQYDYFFEPKLYGFGNASGEKDAIKDLDLRVIAGVGLGYQWIETADLKFATEAGAAWLYENYSNNTPTQSDPAVRYAHHLKWNLPHDLAMFHDLEALKAFGDPKDYLVKADVGVRDNFMPNFFAEAKIEYQWDSTPANGAKRTDTLYILGVGWSF